VGVNRYSFLATSAFSETHPHAIPFLEPKGHELRWSSASIGSSRTARLWIDHAPPILSRLEESGMTLTWGGLHWPQNSCSERTLNVSAFKYYCCRSGRQFKFSEPWLCFRLLGRCPSHAGRLRLVESNFADDQFRVAHVDERDCA
jgi:hypothetical protein